MAHSLHPKCGQCSGSYEPSRGGWSHGYTVREGMSDLREGANVGDPLHDSCYKSISRAQVRLILPWLVLIVNW